MKDFILVVTLTMTLFFHPPGILLNKVEDESVGFF